jgi:carboxyl-terminal processing protease
VDGSRNKRGTLRFASVALTVLLVLLVFVVGVWVGGHPRQTGLDQLPSGARDRLVDEDRTAISTQVLAILKDSYYKPLPADVVKRVENKSVNALVAELGDPYTEYLDPDQYSRFKDDRAGKYVGVGIEWHPKGDQALIIRVFPEGPAATAGIRAADRVVAVDGKKVARADGFAAMQTVKGTEGTNVTLRVARTGVAQRDYVMTRAEIRRPVIESRIETSGARRVGYVRLDQFTDGSAKAFSAAVRRLVDDGVDGLVFDLRGDGGGLVDEAIGVASVFLPKDATIATTRGRGGPTDTLEARGGAIEPKVPLVVLVDQNSASASEIVAGALHDEGRAKVVGTRTFGKALIQSTRQLANGGALKFTVASYLTPDGFDLGAKGLPPDVQAVDNPTTSKDEALQKAVAEVTTR